MDIEKSYQEWLSSPLLSKDEKESLLSLSKEEKEDAFFMEAPFGTGGMRGKLGLGLNRLNRFTIGKAAYGFGLFLDKVYEGAKEKGVAISHDNRDHSREFALLCGDILNGLGFKTYLFDSLRPVPELSYAVRYAHCAGGIMITASHNPKEYNGFKAYDDTGCQLTPDTIAPLLQILDELGDPLLLETKGNEKGERIIFDAKIDDSYCALVESIQLHPELDKKGFKIIYSPQHGASYENAMRIFSELGYEIIPVKEQCVHDPYFGATKSPNPEIPVAWELSLEYAKRHHADLCVMTDPDGDRCGLAYLAKDGSYQRLTGNQSGALLIDYILSCRKASGTLPADGVIYDTIVTSTQGEDIARSYGVKVESFLTGFKYIGDRIGYYEKLGHGPTFLFGYEESYGCLISPFVRDKDGVQAILLYTEMALYYARQGLSLGEAYENLQKKYGYHDADTISVYFEGLSGHLKMDEMMKGLREEGLKEIDGIAVKEIRDYELDIVTFADGGKEAIKGLPKSDVLKYVLSDGSTVTVRPSGTEPKIKFYIEAVAKEAKGVGGKVSSIWKYLIKKLSLPC
jgi:phosphoglucomutase